MKQSTYYGLSAMAGAAWGALAFVVSAGAFGDLIWGGVLASPVIGLVIGWVSRPMARWRLPFRILGSLVCLYLAAVLYGVSIGVADLVVLKSSDRIAWAVVAQSANAVLWGLTMVGWFVLLWPLCFATHWLLIKWSDPHDNRRLAS